MSDLVNRSYLLAEYDRQHQGPTGGARKIIEEAPSAELEIVHCKDCIYWWKEHELCKRNKDTRHNCAYMACKAEFFCANAVRRIDDAD